MLDFTSLGFNTENPTLLTVVITVLFSFMLSGMIVFTYDKTSRHTAKPIHFMQAMILIAVVTTTVMQAIGDSLARGLGMLGALSIIRFRTTVRNPRNIVFMFSSLASGIACGVYGFEIAFIGTLGFCIIAFMLRFTPFSKRENLIGSLSLELEIDSPEYSKLKNILKKNTAAFSLKRYRLIQGRKKDRIQYTFELKLYKEEEGTKLLKALSELENARRLSLDFNDLLVDRI